jgi:hypothetical protein
MTDAGGSRSAWLVLAFGDDRQYAGNTGYDDELAETYRYDSNVANWKRVAAGDLLLLRDREQLIGVARVRRIESYPSMKSLHRCPVCRTTSIKQRRQREPRFRCNDGHEFPQPVVDNVRCSKLEARFEGSFRRASSAISIEQLRRACPKYTDQLSIQRLKLPDLADDLRRAVPGYEALLVDSGETAPPDEVTRTGAPETASAPQAAPPEGELGVPYRRPNEESLVAGRDPLEIDPAAVERANSGHARTQNVLADRLTALGLTPRSPAPTEPDYDLGWEIDESLFVAEIKSVTAMNEEKQLRLGLGQVLRYRYLIARGGGRVTGILMLERAPRDRTWSKLCGQLGVVLLWPDMLEGLPTVLFPRPLNRADLIHFDHASESQ